MGAWFGNQILGWFLALVYGGVETLWDLLSTSFLVSPDVTALPQVSTVMDTSLVVVNTCYGLAVVVAGLIVMVGGTVQIRYTVGDLLPRLVVGFVAANFARPLCSNLVEIANGLTMGVTGDTVSSDGSFPYMLTVIMGAAKNEGANGVLLVVIGLLLAMLTGTLLCAWYTRLGILIALVSVAPIGLACHGLPYTEAAARLWWRSMLGCLGTVTVQAFALHSTLSVLSDPDANYSTLGLSTDPTSVVNLLVVVCMLWVTVRIPSMARRFVTSTGGHGHNPVGVALRMMVIGTVSRLSRVPSPRGRSPRALPAAGRAARTAAPATTRAGGYRPSVGDAVISYWRPRLPRPAPATRTTASTSAVGGSAPSGAGRATPAPGGGGGRSGSARSAATPPARPVIPAGVTPATAVPRTRPAWQTRAAGATPPPVARVRSVPPPRRVPPGTTPATATPRPRPTRRV